MRKFIIRYETESKEVFEEEYIAEDQKSAMSMLLNKPKEVHWTKVEVEILVSDFQNNQYWNTLKTMEGCPIQRAFIRANLLPDSKEDKKGKSYSKLIDRSSDLNKKVLAMFLNKVKTETFIWYFRLPYRFEFVK